MEIFAVIMAGGVGARFWPRSREKTPKQLLKIFNDKSLIKNTIDRLGGLIPDDHIYIVTNKTQKSSIKTQLGNIPTGNIIAEPFGKNTAAAIGLSASIIQNKSKDAILVTLPADHIIKEKDLFQQAIKKAVDFADKSGGLLTIGINPVRPETGYGYIQIDDKPKDDSIYKVLTFAEKPNFATAVRFIESGDFLWNSGMFIWKAEAILSEMKAYMPELDAALNNIRATIGTSKFNKTLTVEYGQLKSISIDYGVMEKSSKVFLVKGNFSWSDVGSWEEVYQLSVKDGDGNAVAGNYYNVNSTDSYVYAPEKFTALIGVENLIVIDTKDALLVCKRDQAQSVKNIVDYLKLKKLSKHL
jgi:mannose-1-phosphate guanylyltransferase